MHCAQRSSHYEQAMLLCPFVSAFLEAAEPLWLGDTFLLVDLRLLTGATGPAADFWLSSCINHGAAHNI